MSKIELIRQNLHRSRYKSQASTQITLDDDFIVPDAMDDMEKIIVNSGDVILDSVRNQTERVMIRGKLAFQVLYRNPEGGLQTLAGSIAIEEPMNVPGLEEKDETGVSWELEDLSTEMSNPHIPGPLRSTDGWRSSGGGQGNRVREHGSPGRLPASGTQTDDGNSSPEGQKKGYGAGTGEHHTSRQ